jgi:LAS superfamily LD-carboxypeptidase LdcB
MKRLEFLKLNILAGLGFNLFNFQIPDSTMPLFLTGRKKPELYPNQLLDKAAYPDFQNMYRAALKEGIKIQVVSGYRHFNDQLRIWNTKYTKYKKLNLSEEEIFKNISTYSAIPGTSRHHWGTEIDIIDANAGKPSNGYLNPENYLNGGRYEKLYRWMTEFSEDFGFYLVYTDEEYRNGFSFEPWHYSYKPLARNYLKQYSRLDLVQYVKDDKIGGNNYLDKNLLLSYFHSHVLGINPLLLP